MSVSIFENQRVMHFVSCVPIQAILRLTNKIACKFRLTMRTLMWIASYTTPDAPRPISRKTLYSSVKTASVAIDPWFKPDWLFADWSHLCCQVLFREDFCKVPFSDEEKREEILRAGGVEGPQTVLKLAYWSDIFSSINADIISGDFCCETCWKSHRSRNCQTKKGSWLSKCAMHQKCQKAVFVKIRS